MSRELRSDARRNRQTILMAADRLFAEAADGRAVSTEDVAAAARLGKGSVFRAFGDRAGLLRAVYEMRAEELRAAVVDARGMDLGDTPHARISQILRRIVEFKIANLQLARAVEDVSGHRGSETLFDSPSYRAVHRVLAEHIESLPAATTDRGSPAWLAHVLLSAVRVDLIDHLLGDMSPEHLEEAVDLVVERLLPV